MDGRMGGMEKLAACVGRDVCVCVCTLCVSGRQSVLIWEAEWVRPILVSVDLRGLGVAYVCVVCLCVCVSQRFLSPQLMLIPILPLSVHGPGCVCGCARLLAIWGWAAGCRYEAGQVSVRSPPLPCKCAAVGPDWYLVHAAARRSASHTHTHTHKSYQC
mmetsp:Transcript_28998/g.83800  ORF Transcript_28998/g.83800 Transcript_28998/m.83800 type:complete len:159 (+) Transcript_28998:199-675(+)